MGGVPQGSKLGPIAFVVKINMLPSVIAEAVVGNGNNDVVVDEDTILFMDDTTISEALDVHNHISGTEIGNIPQKINSVKNFAEIERMELNPKKCKEMIIDFRKDRTAIPATEVDECILERVSSYKLLGLWLDDDLKWRTNTEYIVKKAAKRLYLLKNLKGYNAPRDDLKTIYTSAIRSIVEYGAQIWHGSLTEEQSRDIERIQKRAMKIICPEKNYEQALTECGIKTLESRRELMCINLIKDIKDPSHKLNDLLPPTVGQLRERDTRLNVNKIYNFKCRTERFRNSPLVYAIRKYNLKIDDS
ncbi:uncharacterized protein LOC114543542 [Dendronephthya gigantea]|uniref:uncharacterized protein LOC114543542 n=1 Tax=Dendronephthya gigantea TaxID=151771 RepID=UPI00106A14B4|nr:uncharacterized protein LOC114543542 [Dendronephthya gigantea]